MELAKSDWATIRKSPPWAIDSWGLGKFLLFLLIYCCNKSGGSMSEHLLCANSLSIQFLSHRYLGCVYVIMFHLDKRMFPGLGFLMNFRFELILAVIHVC